MKRLLAASLLALTASSVSAQRPDPVAMQAAQREAMKKLAILDGTWRGPATTTLPGGETHTITQTERVGSLLDGTIKLIEGRGYAADGKTVFNAFAVVSWDARNMRYNFRSHAQGFTGDYVYTPTEDGFTWEIPAGPMTMRYKAVVKNGEWIETGERVEKDKPPVKFFEMKLKRIGDTDWPLAGSVSPK